MERYETKEDHALTLLENLGRKFTKHLKLRNKQKSTKHGYITHHKDF